MLDNYEHLPLAELRQQWAEAWRRQPHVKIGRKMLAQSLAYKHREQAMGGLPKAVQERLKTLITAYKRNPRYFDEGVHGLKPGTRLVKTWKEQRHTVLVVQNGFEYRDKIYTSLSEVAASITGSRWNGWVFFGLKKHNRKSSVGKTT